MFQTTQKGIELYRGTLREYFVKKIAFMKKYAEMKELETKGDYDDSVALFFVLDKELTKLEEQSFALRGMETVLGLTPEEIQAEHEKAKEALANSSSEGGKSVEV